MPMAEKDLSADVALAVRKWQKKRGALIMVLHEIQGRLGYVPREIALELSKQMNVPLARIYEVLTFYNFFELEPPAKYVISGCMGTACYLKGTPGILQEFSRLLGIEVGQTTPDGRFSLTTVRCVGCCGQAPVVLINGEVHSKVSPQDVPHLLAQCKD
ncbi:MAG TPA: NAD(P)H-dependent oxidoreductase subunit E [Armatimonadetes bacterium]|nr:NAD(P)H-dependent oxidoreductase subunit E [Armatimonadota bacterium]